MSTNMETTYKFTKSSKTRATQKPSKVPRQDSPNVIDKRNRTSFHPDQADWSWDNLPDILYQFKPEGKVKRNEEPPSMTYAIHGNFLREFAVLPDNISSAVEEFRVEAWMRLDRRIRLRDITDRMHPEFRLNPNALQQRGVRFRQAFNLIAWDSGNKRSIQLEAAIIQKMLEKGIEPVLNSTRGLTPGLTCPTLGEEGGRIPLPAGYGNKTLGGRGKKSEPKPKPERQRQSPVITHKEKIIEYVENLELFDENKEHPTGALPGIQEIIPDEQLPTTIDMLNNDLSFNFDLPELPAALATASPFHFNLPDIEPISEVEALLGLDDYDLNISVPGPSSPTDNELNMSVSGPSSLTDNELDMSVSGLSAPTVNELDISVSGPSSLADDELFDMYCNLDSDDETNDSVLSHDGTELSLPELIYGLTESPVNSPSPAIVNFDFPSATEEIYPLTEPMLLDIIPESFQNHFFRSMMEQCYTGERILPELPVYF